MTHEQRAAIDAMLRQPPPEGPQTIEAMRAGFAAFMSRMAVPEAITTTRMSLGGRPALLVEPVGKSEPGTILYFHGGSFSLGSPETALSLTGNLVVRTGMRAWSLDYRLAPEDPFPAGGEDALNAYRALLDDGLDPTSIVFAGDSAGGGLTVTTLLRAREAGLPMPAAIVAFSPGLDSSLTGDSLETREGIDPLFTRKALERTASMYRGDQNARQPLLSPAVYADATGFPPMLLQVGTNELLLDDATRMATRAIAAGVDVILDVTADVPHVFQAFAGRLDEADQALDRAALFITQQCRITKPQARAGQ